MIKNIVFSGGGLKGWAYIGSIRALNELLDINQIEQVIGTSIGSLFGLFYILQIEWKYLLDFFINLDFKELIDIDIDNIFTNQSILKGHMYTKLIKNIIGTKVNPDITFRDLFKKCKILFTVNAFNITKSKNQYFNYLLTPNVKVVDVLLASSSIPIIFPPCKIRSNAGSADWYYDGGITNNCAFELVNELQTIVLDIGIYDNTNNTNIKIYDLITALSTISNNMNSNKKSNYIIFDLINKKYKNDILNINQSKDDIFTIYINGYIHTKNLLFNNFIALPEPINPIRILK